MARQVEEARVVAHTPDRTAGAARPVGASDRDDGLASQLGVTPNEGASLLAEQGVYVDVKSGDIRSG